MTIGVGIIQCSFSASAQANTDKVIGFLKLAKGLGAQVVLIPELFLGHYFCKTQDDKNFDLAMSVENNPYLDAVRLAAKQLELVVPFPFFERSGPHFYNSVAMIDADGEILGVYRKSHIPDGPGYQEKFYFRPGNTGFMVFDTRYGIIGTAICWDQWFPEAARLMALQGAELLLYPTAIGSEPNNPSLSTLKPWRRVMQGHAVANMIPVAAANRVGLEGNQSFYGASFVSDQFGELLVDMADEEGVRVAQVDLASATAARHSFGFFRDRRVDLYTDLLD
jgi:N-carbamoylputrescine amidase